MKNDAVSLRPAEFRDADAIFRLIKEYPDELLPRPLSDIVQNIDRALVAESNGTVVGTASWQIMPEIGKPKKPCVEIKSLAVDKARAGTGIGRALLEEIIRHIKSMHPSRVIALTFKPDFFSKLGFKEVPKQDLIHKIYAGCINCTKYDSPFTCPEVAMSLDLEKAGCNGGSQ